MDPECRPGEGIEQCISNVIIQVSERQEMIRLAVATEEYRDRLFCFIFGSEEHKDWTLSLYNAVSGTSYTDPNLIMMWRYSSWMSLICMSINRPLTRTCLCG